MLNIMLTGIGGQGTVLAAKVLAQAAQSKGWQVRTAETIGMAQRGGSVVSHVRIAADGEQVHSPLIPQGAADMIISFEPAEAARCLGYLAPDGVIVSAKTPVVPVTASLAKKSYRGVEVTEQLEQVLNGEDAIKRYQLINEAELLAKVGNRKALNIVLLACAVLTGKLPFGIDELKTAVSQCVKPKFVDMNLAAIDLVVEELS